MRKVIWEEGFKRAVKRQTKHQPSLQAKVIAVIQNLAEDPYSPTLKTHKLKGDLKGLWACSVEYDCRIVFRFQELEGETEEAIQLIDMGSHDDVY
jgi:addiction module RelE/StbE family toxin